MSKLQKIRPFLWFATEAEEAAALYTSVFDGRVTDTMRAGGRVVTVAFELFGQGFVALNGNDRHRFNESSSLAVECDDQAEVDRYWEALTADGGAESRCGWLKDRFGVSWQIVPKALPRLLQDPDPGRAARAMQAMLTMSKIDVAALEEAAQRGSAE